MYDNLLMPYIYKIPINNIHKRLIKKKDLRINEPNNINSS